MSVCLLLSNFGFIGNPFLVMVLARVFRSGVLTARAESVVVFIGDKLLLPAAGA
jgi:hypothetical protein